MLEDASNQELLASWQRGDERAAQVLVKRYMARLTALARSRLSRKLSRRLDPEDVVLSAWRSFFVATGRGQVTVPDHDDLWPLLVTLTLRKLARQTARQAAQRRDFNVEGSFDVETDWRAAISRDPSPDQAAILADEVEALMASLDTTDREILTLRLQGEDQAAIAAAMKCSERTIRRALQRIRDAVTKCDDVPEQTPTLGTEDIRDDGGRKPPHRREMPPLASSRSKCQPEPTIHYTDIVLQKLIGQGGFGKVYRALRRSDGAIVAVKYLKKRFWKEPRATQSLLEETTRVAVLSHPNIIRHHGWGLSRRGAVFVVMDWIEGSDTREWARTEHPSLAEILACGVTIARAVAAAHSASVIHGDLTPSNVLRRQDGEFILTDFGFARSLKEPAPSHPGGTPGFLAPEQVSDVFGPVSERTDVYGIGGLMYALLTGRPPMIGRDVPEILANVLSSRPPTPASEEMAGISPELDSLLLRCLNKESADRPSSAAEVGEILGSVVRKL